jgi:MtaA/CmuA family methyltransferase
VEGKVITEKERLLAVLNRRGVDRPPVVIPGGGMNATLLEVMSTCGYAWPKAHNDPASMAGLAQATKEQTAIENVGVPFCMTLEAEAFGSRVDYSSEKTEPRVTQYSAILGANNDMGAIVCPEQTAQMAVVLEALDRLKSSVKEAPIIGNVVGPMSVATSAVDPLRVYKMVVREPETLNRLLDATLERSISFAKAQVAHGADVIMIADPTATGEILGARAFKAFELPRLQKLTAAVHEAGALVIVHICGDIQSILEHIKILGADALSFDSVVNISQVRLAVGELPLMGNISTVLLHHGSPDKIEAAVRRVVSEGIDIVAPACGLSPLTPLANLQAMCRAAKELAAG